MPRTNVHTAGWTWSAVATGVVAALMIQVILVMIGFGVGLIATDVTSTNSTPAWLVFAWWIVSGIFAAAVGAWICGTLSPTKDEGLKAIGGVTTWAVATLIVVAASGFAIGTGATALSALGGPVIAASQSVQNGQGSTARRETVGQARSSLPSAEETRQKLASAMLLNAIGLLCGGVAAYLAGRWSPSQTVLED